MGMTATERLRVLLDERGVEYRWDNGTATWYVDGVMYNAWGRDNERLTMSVCHLTPEQAIAATLGDSDTTGARQRDAVEVVRCRDCAHAVVSRPFYTFAGRTADIEVWRCDYFWNADELPEVESDGFCAWASRKESE